MDLRLKGRVALVTGASKGIGKAIARGLARTKASTSSLLARGKEALDQAAEQIRREHRREGAGRSRPTFANIEPGEGRRRRGRKAEFGTIHIVVNNAGSGIRRQDRQITWPDADWLDDLNLKLIGMLRVMQSFMPVMPRDWTGRVINISGIAGVSAFIGALTHGLNNSAMNHATSYLARDLAAEKITVNTVVPGLIATEWRHGWAENMAQAAGEVEGTVRRGHLQGLGHRVRDAGAPWRNWPTWWSFLASDRAVLHQWRAHRVRRRLRNQSEVVSNGQLKLPRRPAFSSPTPKLFRQSCYIDGAWVNARSGATIAVDNPATGEIVGTVPKFGAAETREAIEAADRAFPAWRKKTAKERAAVLRRWFDLMMANQEDLARLMTTEQGKPLDRVARRGGVCRRVPRMVRRGSQARLRRHDSRPPVRQAHHRHQAADRRGRVHHAVELPAGDDHAQGRSGDCRRLHRGAEARVADAVLGAGAGRARRARRHPEGRLQRRHRLGRRNRRRADRESRSSRSCRSPVPPRSARC